MNPEHLDSRPEALAAWLAYQPKEPWPSGLLAYRRLSALAEFSGAAAFLALQEFVASGFVAEPERPTGVAFGHLRNPRPGQPAWIDGEVSGQLPWFTGAGMLQDAILGFHLPSGEEAYALVSAEDRPEFRWSAPLPLIACSGTHTVSVTLNRLKVESFLRVDPPGSRAANDRKGVLWQTPLMVGCIRASCRLLARPTPSAGELCARLEDGIANGATLEEGLALRVEAAESACRLARLAAIASGSGSLMPPHPAERLYRESLLWSLMAQTPEIGQLALERGSL